jgi:ABC-type lipoprotein export system ATPase subunit
VKRDGLFVTHSVDLARHCDKTIEVIDGGLTG